MALLRNITCNWRHPRGLGHPVSPVTHKVHATWLICIVWDIPYMFRLRYARFAKWVYACLLQYGSTVTHKVSAAWLICILRDREWCLCHTQGFCFTHTVSVSHIRCLRHTLYVFYETSLICFASETCLAERWGAGVETQKNVRGEIGGWGRVPFNEPYAPSLSTIYDGA